LSESFDPTRVLALEDLADLAPRLEAARARVAALPPRERAAALEALRVIERELEAELRDLARRKTTP
jgi:hypothetical protein